MFYFNATMMLPKCLTARIVIILIILSGFTVTRAQGDKQQRFEQYLIGIKHVESAYSLSEPEKMAYYKKLVEITGFTADSAKVYVEKYREHPEKWAKLIDDIIAFLEKNDKENQEQQE